MEKTEQSGKVPAYDVQFLPVKGKRLTPKKAREWMRVQFPAFQAVAAEIASHAETVDERHAVSGLAHAMQSMVSACTRATDSGKPVRVNSWGDSETDSGLGMIAKVGRILALCSKLDGVWDPERALVARELGAAVATFADREQKKSYRSLPDLDAARDAQVRRMEELYERSRAIEARAERHAQWIRDQAVEISDAVLRDHWRLANILGYESNLMGHELIGSAHPGEPPPGYDEWQREQAR